MHLADLQYIPHIRNSNTPNVIIYKRNVREKLYLTEKAKNNIESPNLSIYDLQVQS